MTGIPARGRWAAALLLATLAAPDAGSAPQALAAELPSAAPPASEPAATSKTATVYFFSPDWRPADLGAFAQVFEQAFGAGGVEVSFQGFARYEDFERQLFEKAPDFMIAPAWIATAGPAARCPSLRIVAHPQRKGRSTYRKALMSRAGVDSVDDLAHGTIAATLYSFSEGSVSAVLEAFHLAGDGVRLVAVPKDIDALLALSFAQVDAALVTAAQYEQLAARSPAEAESLRVLAFTAEVPLPPAFVCSAHGAELVDAFRGRLASLGNDATGVELLAMLGFDAWIPIAPQPAPSPAARPSGDRRGGRSR